QRAQRPGAGDGTICAPQAVQAPEKNHVADPADDARDRGKSGDPGAERQSPRGRAVGPPERRRVTLGDGEIETAAERLVTLEPEAGGKVLEFDGVIPGAVRPPERRLPLDRGGEEQAVPERLEALDLDAARPRTEIAHPPLAPRRAVALPQLDAGDPVVRGEEEMVLKNRHRSRARVTTAGADVGQAPGAVRGAVAAPQLQTVRRIAAGEVDDRRAAVSGTSGIEPDVLDLGIRSSIEVGNEAGGRGQRGRRGERHGTEQ